MSYPRKKYGELRSYMFVEQIYSESMMIDHDDLHAFFYDDHDSQTAITNGQEEKLKNDGC